MSKNKALIAGYTETYQYVDDQNSSIKFIRNIELEKNHLSSGDCENLILFNFCPSTGLKIDKTKIIKTLIGFRKKDLEDLDKHQKVREQELLDNRISWWNSSFANPVRRKKMLEDEENHKKRIKGSIRKLEILQSFYAKT